MGLLDWLDDKRIEHSTKDMSEAEKKKYLWFLNHPKARDHFSKTGDDSAYYHAHPEELPERGMVDIGVHHGIGRSGPRQALIDMISTDDLDGLLYDCAPGLVNQANRTQELSADTNHKMDLLREELKNNDNYKELEGKYNELQKHYDELKQERDMLIKALAKEDSPQR